MPTSPVMPSRPCPTACQRRFAGGVTLVELLIGMAILAILLALAVPQAGGWVSSHRLSAQAGDFTSSFSYARSEAVRRGIRVTVCKSADPTAAAPACSTAGTWASGWLVFVDNVHVVGNVSGVVDGSDSVLRVVPPLTGATVTADATLSNWISYTPDGLAAANGGSAAGTILLCQGKSGQRLALNSIGRFTATSAGC